MSSSPTMHLCVTPKQAEDFKAARLPQEQLDRMIEKAFGCHYCENALGLAAKYVPAA